jgi:hypothetical protein
MFALKALTWGMVSLSALLVAAPAEAGSNCSGTFRTPGGHYDTIKKFTGLFTVRFEGTVAKVILDGDDQGTVMVTSHADGSLSFGLPNGYSFGPVRLVGNEMTGLLTQPHNSAGFEVTASCKAFL